MKHRAGHFVNRNFNFALLRLFYFIQKRILKIISYRVLLKFPKYLKKKQMQIVRGAKFPLLLVSNCQHLKFILIDQYKKWTSNN